MNTKILEYIIAIAEERSVSKAAARFYLSHAALSRHLKNAENELGAPLFLRERDGMRLTPAGAIYVNDAYAILKLERELERDLAAMRQRSQKTFRVMVDTPLYNRFIRLVLPRFRQECPDIVVDITNCNAAQACRALITGNADMGVFHMMYGQAGNLDCLEISTTALRLAFPKDYTGTMDMEGLQGALDSGMHLILHPVGTTLRILQETILADRHIYPERILEGDSQNAIYNISRGGVCGLLAGMYCSPELKKQIKLSEPVGTIRRVIAYAPGVTLPPTAHTLMKHIIEACPADAEL